MIGSSLPPGEKTAIIKTYSSVLSAPGLSLGFGDLCAREIVLVVLDRTAISYTAINTL